MCVVRADIMWMCRLPHGLNGSERGGAGRGGRLLNAAYVDMIEMRYIPTYSKWPEQMHGSA